MQEYLKGKKAHDPSFSPIFLLYNMESVDLVPAEEPLQGQADAHPVAMALVLCQAP